MRPAAATIWKYLLEREQSPEGVPLFTKFYVGCRERKKERKKGKKKEKWVKRREKTTGTLKEAGGGRSKNLERQRLWTEERSGWRWSRKRKDAGWKRTEGKEACKVAFRLSREKHRPRRIGVNGVSPRGNSIGPIFVLDLLPSCPLPLPLIFIMDTLKFGKHGKEIITKR